MPELNEALLWDTPETAFRIRSAASLAVCGGNVFSILFRSSVAFWNRSFGSFAIIFIAIAADAAEISGLILRGSGTGVRKSLCKTSMEFSPGYGCCPVSIS